MKPWVYVYNLVVLILLAYNIGAVHGMSEVCKDIANLLVENMDQTRALKRRIQVLEEQLKSGDEFSDDAGKEIRREIKPDI